MTVESYAEWEQDNLPLMATSIHQHVDICIRPNGLETSRSVYHSTPRPLGQDSAVHGLNDSPVLTADPPDPPDPDVVMDMSTADSIWRRLAGVRIHFISCNMHGLPTFTRMPRY